MRRRDLLTGSLAALAAGLPGRPALAATSLGDAAARARVTFGSAFDRDAVDDRAYGDLLRREARILTTDWSMKFGALRPRGPEADFTGAERLVRFAEEARIPVRGHTLIWNENNPDWLRKLSRERRASWLDRHVGEVMEHFAGRIHSWDVVNEPFWPDHGNKGGFRGGPWYDALGPGYVLAAFRAAAKADPGAKLVLNEAFTESGDRLGLTVRAGLLRLVDDIRAAGLRLDAVGLQGHITRGRPFDPVGWRRFLADLAARDVEIWITELDVDDHTFSGAPAERDARVAEVYRAVLDTALDEPKVTTVITWELADGFSHYRDVHGADARPLPFDRDLKPKPAFDAMVEAFRAHAPR
jgi:endo-1,4-beta-xylanase